MREDLDCHAAFGIEYSPHALAASMLALLKAFADHIVPAELHPPADLEPAHVATWCVGMSVSIAGLLVVADLDVCRTSRLLDQLPTLHHNVLVYVVLFLRECLAHSAANGSTPDMLGEEMRWAHVIDNHLTIETCFQPHSSLRLSSWTLVGLARRRGRRRVAR